MRAASRSVLHAAFGAAAGLAGLAAARCGGGACSTCLACAVPGVGVVALALLGRPRPRTAAADAARPGSGGAPLP